MFSSISIQQYGGVDFGVLAEALIFYQNVQVVANTRVLEDFVRILTPEVFLELLESDYLKVIYLSNYLGIHTQGTGTPQERHNPTCFSIGGRELGEQLPKLFRQVVSARERANKLATRAYQKIDIATHPDAIIDESRLELSDHDFTTAAATVILKAFAPTYKSNAPLFFRTVQDGNLLRVKTNIDFAEANEAHRRLTQTNESQLFPAYLLTSILEMKGHLYFAATLNSEMAVQDVSAHLIQLRLARALARRGASQKAMQEFQEFAFEDARAIAHALTKDGRTFQELLPVLERARKFKEWLRDKPIDARLIREYYKEVIAPTWVDKLPSKVTRWLLLTGIGIGVDALGAGGLGTVAAAGLCLADTLYVDKLLKGWKPNQFIEGPLRELVQRKK